MYSRHLLPSRVSAAELRGHNYRSHNFISPFVCFLYTDSLLKSGVFISLCTEADISVIVCAQLSSRFSLIVYIIPFRDAFALFFVASLDGYDLAESK